jgi:UDP-sugar transporter A1/2/3
MSQKRRQSNEKDIEEQDPLVPSTSGKIDASTATGKNDANSGGITAMGLKVLILLAVQNSSKNLLMRYVMKEKPDFLSSAAVIGSECTKLSLSLFYILCIEKQSVASIIKYFKDDWKNTLLVSVPASAYNLQMSLEYIALANLDAAMFSVLVQTKLVFTAVFSAIVIRKKLKYIQVISLTLLTVGVMLCNMKFGVDQGVSNSKGIIATLGIAVSSGFASVYTEKVIKSQRLASPVTGQYSLAYTQVQLASMSLFTIGIYACLVDFKKIVQHGLFYNFNGGAFLTVFNSAIGGLIVAGVLKYADSVLKGYATAVSVIGTGIMSMILFGTELHVVYFMGIVNVVVAVLLYNGKNFDEYVCS